MDEAATDVMELARRFRVMGIKTPRSILDFGFATSDPPAPLHGAFPDAQVTALDVHPPVQRGGTDPAARLMQFGLYDGGEIPIAHGSIDLVYAPYAFHRLDAGEHVRVFRYLSRILAPGGVLAVFEHNPLSPMAPRRLEGPAALIPAHTLAGRQRQAGFQVATVAYTGFFPDQLHRLLRYEPYLSRLPLGARYYTLAGH